MDLLVLHANILHVQINALIMASASKDYVIVNQVIKVLIVLKRHVQIIVLGTVTVKIKNVFVNLVGKEQTVH